MDPDDYQTDQEPGESLFGAIVKDLLVGIGALAVLAATTWAIPHVLVALLGY